jgi:hypothetical protein
MPVGQDAIGLHGARMAGADGGPTDRWLWRLQAY